MKKIIRMLLTLVISLTIIATLPVSAFAYEYGELNLEEMIQVEKIGEKEITSISASDLNRIRISKSKEYRYKSDEEKLEEICTALGVELNGSQSQEMNSKVSLSDVGAIETSTVYLEIDEEGNQKEISEAMALSASQKVEGATENISDTVLIRNPAEKTDGKIKQQLTIFYTPHYDGKGTTPDRYVFLGICEWIKDPTCRKTDCIALFGPDFRWNGDKDNYTLLVGYHILGFDNGESFIDEDVLETFDGNYAKVSAYAGAFFEYNLKDNWFLPPGYSEFTNFVFTIMAVGKVSMDVSAVNNIGIDLMYIHSESVLTSNIGFSWSGTGPSASISISKKIITKKYLCNDSWSYKRHYNQFFG